MKNRIQVSKEFPLFHQIAFSDSPDLYKPNRDTLELISKVGIENYRIWDLESARDLIYSIYGKEVVKTFDSLNAFASKSNVARYCITNYLGGTYLDLSVGRLKPFEEGGADMVIFKEGNSNRTSWKVATSFFYSRPNNPVLIECIEEIGRNVENKYYGHDPHFIGGPSVFGRAIAKFGLDINLCVGGYHWFKYRRNKYILPNGTVAARHKRGGAYSGGISGVVGGNNYNDLWNKRAIYKEEIQEY